MSAETAIDQEITFAAGMPGFPGARRFTLDAWGGDDSPFMLLACLDDPDLACEGLNLPLVTLATAPALSGNPYVTIADATTMSPLGAGPTTGARSNIRNAETEIGALSGQVLFDWACHYKLAMTAS